MILFDLTTCMEAGINIKPHSTDEESRLLKTEQLA
jgi:hypothetical protein